MQHELRPDTVALIGAIGAFFLGAVYLGGIIAAGLAAGNKTVLALGLISAGVGYVVQVGSMLAPQQVIPLVSAWGVSVGAAVLAGVLVIFGG